MLGYLLAIITSVFYSIYVIPKKLVKEKTIYYTVFMTLGFFIVSTILYIFFRISGTCNETVTVPIVLSQIFRGLCWFLSAHLYLLSIDKLGVSRSMQYKNLKGPFGVMLTLLVLQEFLITNVVIIITATILTFISAMILTIKNTPEKKIDKIGILYAIIAAVLLGITNLIQKWVTNLGIVYSQHIFTSVASFFFAFLYVVIKEKSIKDLITIPKKSILLAMLGGSGYYLASLFQAFSFERLPGSIVTIIVQLSAVWSILIGIVIFKEIDLRKHWKRISLGIVMTIISIVILL